jgi:hypothetical protein
MTETLHHGLSGAPQPPLTAGELHQWLEGILRQVGAHVPLSYRRQGATTLDAVAPQDVVLDQTFAEPVIVLEHPPLPPGEDEDHAVGSDSHDPK